MGSLLIEEQTHKICAFCKEDLSTEYFHKHGEHTGGITRYESYCKKCKSQKRCNQKDIINSMLSAAKARAKKKNLEFSLTRNFIIQLNEKQNGLCSISGAVLNWDKNAANSQENSCFANCPTDRVSLDRKDSSKGYTESNTQLVCAFVNFAKSTHDIEELLKYCKLIVDYNNL